MLSKDHLMRPREVAEILRVSKATVYRWFWKGKLEGVQIGERSIRIFGSAIKGAPQ